MEFRQRYGPWAIVAGGSTGVGRSFARRIAAQGVSCILVANGGPLEEAAEELRREFGIECSTALLDLSRPDACECIVAAAGDREVGLYVASAGFDHSSGYPFHDREIASWLHLMRFSVVATVEALHHFGRPMRERRRGGLIIVNSGAAYGGGKLIATYAACKSFLLNFGEGLWSELRPYGVDVLNVMLGMVDTPSLRKVQAELRMPASDPAASPDEIAVTALDCLPNGPVYNHGFADDERGFYPCSASERRANVIAMEAAAERLYARVPATPPS